MDVLSGAHLSKVTDAQNTTAKIACIIRLTWTEVLMVLKAVIEADLVTAPSPQIFMEHLVINLHQSHLHAVQTLMIPLLANLVLRIMMLLPRLRQTTLMTQMLGENGVELLLMLSKSTVILGRAQRNRKNNRNGDHTLNRRVIRLVAAAGVRTCQHPRLPDCRSEDVPMMLLLHHQA
jgi:hypothetical protein